MTNTEIFFMKHVKRFDSIDTNFLKEEKIEDDNLVFNSIVQFGLKIVKFEDEYFIYYYSQNGALKDVDDCIVAKFLELEKITSDAVLRILRDELRTQF